MAHNKLLLLEDVESLGRSGDIVSVRPGYARNFLLPQGFAVAASANALRMQAKLIEERQKKAAVDRQESEEVAARLEGVQLSTIVKVDHEGHMYGSVNTIDILHLLQNELNIALEKRSIQLKHPIKETGVYTIPVKLKEGVSGSFKIKVVSDIDQQTEASAPQEATEE